MDVSDAAFIAQTTPQIGQALGQNFFPEGSRLFGRFEDNLERFPAASAPVLVLPGILRRGIDVVTNSELAMRNGGPSNVPGFTGLAGLNLMLDTNNEFETGSSGEPPLLSLEVPLAPGALRNRSYIALQGSGFFLTGFNWSIEMRFLPPAGEPT